LALVCFNTNIQGQILQLIISERQIIQLIQEAESLGDMKLDMTVRLILEMEI
jgi:hypothetical protein